MKNKLLITRLIISIVIWVIAIIIQYSLEYSITVEIIYLSLYIVAYGIAGYDIVFGAIRNILSGNMLDEYFLMSIATIGAFFIRFFGDIEYLEAVAVMVFFQVGELFQAIATEKSRKAILETMDLKVEECLLENGDIKNPNDVNIGDVIIVKPGEVIPIDGVMVTEGTVNMASLTGEALDVDMSIGDEVLSGSINTTTPIKIRVSKKYVDSTSSKILDMVENATMKKANSERFITKFARVYTPIVVGFALVLGGLVPLIICLINGFGNASSVFGSYIYAALTCLVVSCPCALVLSVPLSYFAGIGACARKKVIVKGGISIEELAKCDTIILDKTGTLTKAEFEVTKVYGDENEILKIAKGLEINSTHPLAKAINKINVDYYSFEVSETPGFGIVGFKDNIRYICGSKKLLEKHNIEPIDVDLIGSVLYVAKDDLCIGAIILEDILKDEAISVIKSLVDSGKRVVMLSGDTKHSVESIANRLGIKEYHYGLLPSDKVEIAERIIKSNETKKVMFVGDGINDAPVLAMSDIGVSMGQIGSDSALEASDVVVLNDNLNAIPVMINVSKKTRRIVIENIVFIILVKVLILLLSAVASIGIIEGFKMPMWVAIFGDVGVCILAVLNSMRALKVK
ncbi:MAG: cadmium-translocating P-type ATPase [Acholeplasmatales bacterium]|nr:cadmium-translocating P-type ATPase [Acholeplasmatales bacterium]